MTDRRLNLIWVFRKAYRPLKYILRVLFLVMVVYVLYGSVSISQLGKAFSHASFIWILPAFLFYFMKYAIQAVRWYIAVRAHGQKILFTTAIRAQFEIAFLENLFPVPDSEDGLKLVYMNQEEIGFGPGAVIILYDRIIGITILLLLLPFVFFLYAQNILPAFVVSFWFQIVFLLVAFSLIAFHRRILRWGLSVLQKKVPHIGQKGSVLKKELEREIPQLTIITSLLLTFLQAVCNAFTIWLLVNAFLGKVSFIYILAGIPLYQMSAIVPLSIQGLGLYETAVVFVLEQQKVNHESALMIGLVHFSFHFFAIILAGVSYLLNTDKAIIEDTFLRWSQKFIKAK